MSTPVPRSNHHRLHSIFEEGPPSPKGRKRLRAVMNWEATSTTNNHSSFQENMMHLSAPNLSYRAEEDDDNDHLLSAPNLFEPPAPRSKPLRHQSLNALPLSFEEGLKKMRQGDILRRLRREVARENDEQQQRTIMEVPQERFEELTIAPAKCDVKEKDHPQTTSVSMARPKAERRMSGAARSA